MVLRVVERAMGCGHVERDGQSLGEVAYELALYRQWSSGDGTLVARGFEVTGHVVAPADRLDTLMGVAAPVWLTLDDGRSVALYVVSADGTVTHADERGFRPGTSVPPVRP